MYMTIYMYVTIYIDYYIYIYYYTIYIMPTISQELATGAIRRKAASCRGEDGAFASGTFGTFRGSRSETP